MLTQESANVFRVELLSLDEQIWIDRSISVVRLCDNARIPRETLLPGQIHTFGPMVNFMSQPSFEPSEAHHWFAVEFNNEAWDLLEKENRSVEESDRLLHLAHAAWIHWKAVGVKLNEQRAECLLAFARSENHDEAIQQSALKSALRARRLLGETSEATPFDTAMTHAALARSRAISAGDSARDASEALATAVKFAARIPSAEDRDYFQTFLDRFVEPHIGPKEE